MARSRKATAVRGVTAAKSEKSDKRRANRALRRLTRQTLASDSTFPVAPEPRDVSNVWNMAKEGKHYLKDPRPKDLRK